MVSSRAQHQIETGGAVIMALQHLAAPWLWQYPCNPTDHNGCVHASAAAVHVFADTTASAAEA
jgi:hypothetical protein